MVTRIGQDIQLLFNGMCTKEYKRPDYRRHQQQGHCWNTCSDNQTSLWTQQWTHVECSKLQCNAGTLPSSHLEQSCQLNSLRTKYNSLLTLMCQSNLVIYTCPGSWAKAHQEEHKECPAYNQLWHYCQKVGHYSIQSLSSQTLTTYKLTSCRARDETTKNVYD